MKEINSGVSFPPIMERGTVEMASGHVIDTWLPTANKGNDYNIDREVQRAKSFSGIYGINSQDRGLQESMGGVRGEPAGIVDRGSEHLVSSDRPVVAARRRLVTMAKELRQGIESIAVANPESYFVRGVAKLSAIADFDEFVAANSEELKAVPLGQSAQVASVPELETLEGANMPCP